MNHIDLKTSCGATREGVALADASQADHQLQPSEWPKVCLSCGAEVHSEHDSCCGH